MSLTGADLRERIELVLRAADATEEDVDQLLADGYGFVLSLDSQRLRIERRITELAAEAEEPEAAGELRRLWLEHRTLGAEVTNLRSLLRQLREAQPARS
jgi:hypothetical protein